MMYTVTNFFALHSNDVASEINSLNLCADMDDLQLSILLYAADVPRIVHEASSLQQMLDNLCNLVYQMETYMYY